MYRRHLKMSLLADMESNNNRNSEFLQRVSSIPVVYLAWNVATETYSRLKSSNTLIEVSLTSSEKVIQLVSRPVIHKFRKQLKAADSIAVKGLETLQGVIPRIIQQPERIYRHTKGIYDQTVDNGLQKYKVVKRIGASKAQDLVEFSSQKVSEFLATPYGQICELAVDSAFAIGEIYVDIYLPPLGDERPEMVFGDRAKLPVWKRSEALSNRIRERLYKHTLLKIQRFRLLFKIFLFNVYSFDMSEYVMEVFVNTSSTLYIVAIRLFSNLSELITCMSTIVSTYSNEAMA